MASGRGGRGPKISVGEAIGILLSALGLARSGGDAGGPSDAAIDFARERLLNASEEKLAKPPLQSFAPIPDPIRIPTASEPSFSDLVLRFMTLPLELEVAKSRFLDAITPDFRLYTDPRRFDPTRQSSVIDPGAGAPVAQASILPAIREALEEETATAREEARERTEMREAMKILAAFAERPRDIQGLITVRLRIDQEGRFQVAGVQQQTDKLGFRIVTGVGETLDV